MLRLECDVLWREHQQCPPPESTVLRQKLRQYSSGSVSNAHSSSAWIMSSGNDHGLNILYSGESFTNTRGASAWYSSRSFGDAHGASVWSSC